MLGVHVIKECPFTGPIMKQYSYFQNELFLSSKFFNYFKETIYTTYHVFFNMHKLQTIKELIEFFRIRKKFYLFPIVSLLILMIGLTTLAQSGLIAFIYPI